MNECARKWHRPFLAIALFLLLFDITSGNAQTSQRISRQQLLAMAQKGDADAQYHLGLLYVEGSPNTPKDLVKAAEWFRRSADKGDPKAEFALGIAYRHGYGVTEDDAVSFDWFYKSALKGYPKAQDSLAVAYLSGHGTPQNGSESFHWFFESARNGDSTAQVALCAEYQKNTIVEADPTMAYAWCLIAQGRVLIHPEFFTKYLNAVLEKLTPSQLKEATDIASSWTTNNKIGAAMPMHSRSFLSDRSTDDKFLDSILQGPSKQHARVGGCESGHWVDSVMSDGEIVKLDDGSIWQVDGADAVDSSVWTEADDVTVCDGKLINTDDKSSLEAHRLQ
jgi:Sel1 repeat